MRIHVRAAAPAAVFTSVLLANACGGGDNSTNPLTGFDPDAAVATVAKLTSVAPDSDALASLELASGNFPGGAAAAIQPRTELQGLLGASVLPLAHRLAGLAPSASAVPPELLGKTLVYDPSTTHYAVDETATNAPTDGVRIVYYSIEPFGQPSLPLDSLGYVDITEASTDATVALGVRMVRTTSGAEEIVADYDIGHSATATATVDHVTLDGFIARGTQTTQLSILEDFTESGSDQLSTFQTSLTDPETGESVEFVERDSVDSTGSGESQLTLTVDGDEGVTVLDVTGTPSGGAFRLDGTITFDGTEVATVGGSTPTPSFANPDGSALPSSDRSRLLNLWIAVGVTFNYGFDLVSQLFLFVP